MNLFHLINNNLNKKAIIYCNHNGVEDQKLYKFTLEVLSFLKELLKNVPENSLIALLTNHNIYLPFIIISLNYLNHAFTIVQRNDLESSITSLKVNWVISFDQLSHDDFSLDNEISFENTQVKFYKKKILFQIEENYFKDIFCVVQTSGTTGQNKIVRVSQNCIELNVDSLQKHFKLTSEDFIFWGTPLTFDPSLIELLLAIKSGACLVIVPELVKLNPNYLFQALVKVKDLKVGYEGVNFLQIVPSLFFRWNYEQIKDILNGNLRVLAFGGEDFPGKILEFPRKPSLDLFNLYGITEVSCWASLNKINANEKEISLGVSLDETILEIRDEDGNNLQEGFGEIFIGSKLRICLLENETFIQFNNQIVFRETGDLGLIKNSKIYWKGRKNNIIKRFGNKINLNQIEKLVFEITGLQSKCIWTESSKLVLFVCVTDFKNSIKSKILDKITVKLLHELPKELFPDHIDLLDKFPVNKHGKVDLKLLKSFILLETETKTLREDFCKICSRMFGVNILEYKRQSFFDLGGNSVLVIQLLSELGDYPEKLLENLFENSLESCLDLLEKSGYKRKLEVSESSKEIIKKRISDENLQFQIAWTREMGACVDSSPIIFKFKEENLIAIGSFAHFLAIFNFSGEEKFRFTLPDVVQASPCTSCCGRFIFVPCFDSNLYCFDLEEKTIFWKYNTKDRINCSPNLLHNRIIFGSYDKHLYCIDLKGKLIWKTQLQGGIVSSPLINQLNKTIFISTILGNCYCLNENGLVIWTYQTSGCFFGSPTFLNTKNEFILFPNVKGTIHCLDCKTGIVCWEFVSSGHIYSSLKILNNTLIFGCHDSNLYFLEVTSNSCKLTQKIDLEKSSSNSVTWCESNCNFILCVNNSGKILCLKYFENSWVICGSYQLPNESFSSPCLVNNCILVGCRDNKFYCIKITE